MTIKTIFSNIRTWLKQLSFRTGVIVLLMCIPFYIISFAQMLLPLSVGTKGVLWAVFFGLAKACQYGGLTILGVEGYKRLKNKFRKQDDSAQRKQNGRPIRLIIFDFDGTLGDSQRLITDTMLETIDKMGLEKRTREACASTIGLPLAKCFSTIIPMSDDKADECAEVYSDIFRRNNIPGAVPPFPNVIETIRKLKQNGISLSIASSRHHHSLSQFVNEMKLEDCFTYIIGADDVVHPKPEAEPIERTLAHYGLQADETLMVGDTKFDILMGRNGGTRTCGVTYGNGTADELKNAGADMIIDDIADLLQIVVHNAN